MKKMLLFFSIVLICSTAWADDSSKDAQLVPPIADRGNPSSTSSEDKLVDLERGRTAQRVEELYRRVQDLERQNRFQDDRIRNIERTVDDLRRR